LHPSFDRMSRGVVRDDVPSAAADDDDVVA
jgi:hypothetical protein